MQPGTFCVADTSERRDQVLAAAYNAGLVISPKTNVSGNFEKFACLAYRLRGNEVDYDISGVTPDDVRLGRLMPIQKFIEAMGAIARRTITVGDVVAEVNGNTVTVNGSRMTKQDLTDLVNSL